MVHVYFNNGTHFNHQQNLTGIASDIFVVDVTADGQWLLVVEREGVNRIYNFNSSNNKF